MEAATRRSQCIKRGTKVLSKHTLFKLGLYCLLFWGGGNTNTLSQVDLFLLVVVAGHCLTLKIA